MNPMMRYFMIYGLPALSLVGTSALPASVQLSFATSSVLTVIQSHYLRQGWVRDYLGIQPTPSPTKPSLESQYKGTMTIQASSTPTVEEQPPAPKGVIGGAISDIKGAASQVMKTARSIQQSEYEKRGNHRLTQAELKRAHAYEAQRQREIAQEKGEAESVTSNRRRHRSAR